MNQGHHFRETMHRYHLPRHDSRDSAPVAAAIATRPSDVLGGIFVIGLISLVLLLIEVGLIILGLPGHSLGG